MWLKAAFLDDIEATWKIRCWLKNASLALVEHKIDKNLATKTTLPILIDA